MQNDVLKNKIAPWQEKGRWHHIRLNVWDETITMDYDNSDPVFMNSELIRSDIDKAITNIDQVIDMKYVVTPTSTPINDQPFATYSNGYNFKSRRFEIGFYRNGLKTGYVDLYLYIV